MVKSKFMANLGNIILMLATSGIVFFGGCKNKSGNPQDSRRQTIISYMARPDFVNKEFTKQATGTDAELKIHDLDEKKLYFVIPKENYFEGTLEKLTNNPDHVEFGSEENGKIKLGNYVLNNNDKYFFRFDSSELKVDKDNKITSDFWNAGYTVSLEELTNFLENKNIYGGKLFVEYAPGDLFVNHLPFVINGKENSLERLTNQLTLENESNEVKAQKLLDFVSSEIDYNLEEVGRNAETLKRPNEVLMTKKSDCSGKTILYASLLEQENIPYKLVYFMNGKLKHICVAVKGNFLGDNNLTFSLENERYSIAEPTAAGFKIGESKIEYCIEDINFLQSPGKDSKIYNAKTGAALKFK